MEKPRAIKTRLTDMFNLDYPILAAPMFLVSNGDMVKAASLCGGMGTFPALNFRPISEYKKVLHQLRADLSGAAFGVNIIVQKNNKYQEEQTDLAIEAGVDLIITSLGSPRHVIEKTRGTKTKVFCDVVGLEHAKKVENLGADGLIVVGNGAGGHGGDMSLFALLPYLKKKVNLPMVAAGCMDDGHSLLAALSLGADGIYMGTRVIATTESKVSQDYKQAILQAGCEDIVNTDRVDGFPGNFIRTDNLESVLKPNFIDTVLSQSQKVKRMVSLLRARRALFGSPEDKLSYKNTFSAGQGVGNIEKIESLQDVFWQTAHNYRQCLEQMPS